jgi:selenocysteine-specific elongation factor
VTQTHFTVATAGHVDHGKSALVQALTGIDPDRLPEEKARGITIDLGFAELNLDGPDKQCFDIGIVDVPGHEDFVRNMIAGIGSVDLALLVVAADDGWMPQTEEHLQILTYLGVRHAVIAITKSDLGGIGEVVTHVRKQLQNSPLADSPIVPTSIRTGEGINDLKRAIAAQLSTIPPARNIGKPRLFVDRAFTLHGIGTVVTGTLSGGKFHRGQSVLVQPQNLQARIRSIQNHGRDIEVAAPGMRTAINLPDVKIGASSGAVRRGQAITTPGVGSASDTLDVVLERSARLNRDSPSGRPLKNGAAVYVHHGTTRVRAKILLAETEVLERGKRAIAQLRLESSIFALLGDRVVIRDASERYTIAGGVVLDPDGIREEFRAPVRGAFLAARAAAPSDVEVCLKTELARRGVAHNEMLLSKSNFSTDEVAAALSRLERARLIVRDQGIVADAQKWRELLEHLITRIDDAHSKHPEHRGLELVELRAALPEESDALLQAVIADLCKNGFVRVGTAIARVSHRAALPAEIEPVAEAIRRALAEKPFDPPGRNDLAHEQRAGQALRFLIQQGAVIEASSEIVLLPETADQMRDIVVAFISDHGPATTSELRQKLGTSRRVIIPFLEYLDRIGITIRREDRRILRTPRQAATNLLK